MVSIKVECMLVSVDEINNNPLNAFSKPSKPLPLILSMATYKCYPTFTGKAYWCDPKNGDFAPALIRGMKSNIGDSNDPDSRGVCWFDELLQGGIVLPTGLQSGRALTLLLSGAPGTGKST